MKFTSCKTCFWDYVKCSQNCDARFKKAQYGACSQCVNARNYTQIWRCTRCGNQITGRDIMHIGYCVQCEKKATGPSASHHHEK